MTAQTSRARSLEKALAYLAAELPVMTKKARKTAINKITTSTRPLTTAKAIVRNAPADQSSTGGPFKCPDLSAALEAQATIARRMPAVLRGGIPVYTDELIDLSKAAILQTITQEDFNAKCKLLAQKPLPAWMVDYQASDDRVDATRPIEAVPATALQRALGSQGPAGVQDSNTVIPERPERLNRRGMAPWQKSSS